MAFITVVPTQTINPELSICLVFLFMLPLNVFVKLGVAAEPTDLWSDECRVLSQNGASSGIVRRMFFVAKASSDYRF